MWYTEEQKKEAKSIDLLSYLQRTAPDELVRSGNEYRMVTHSSLVISNGMWRWFAEDKAGTTALQYLMEVEKKPFTEAMEILIGGSFPQTVGKAERKERQGCFGLPRSAASNHRVKRYLQSRCIGDAVLEYCLSRGLVYESEDYHNCVFVGYDRQGWARFATMRGAYDHEDTKKNFRRDADFSDKSFGFCIPSEDPDCNTVYISEAPIDALSLATFNVLKAAKRWRSCYQLALGGSSLLALKRLLNEHPKIKHIEVFTDNDKTGNTIASQIQTMYADEYAVYRHTAKNGAKDPNEALCRYVKRKELER